MRVKEGTQRVRGNRYVMLEIHGVDEATEHPIYFSWFTVGNGIPPNSYVLKIHPLPQICIGFHDNQMAWCKMEPSPCKDDGEDCQIISTSIRISKVDHSIKTTVSDLRFTLVEALPNNEERVIGFVVIPITVMSTKCISKKIIGLLNRDLDLMPPNPFQPQTSNNSIVDPFVDSPLLIMATAATFSSSSSSGTSRYSPYAVPYNSTTMKPEQRKISTSKATTVPVTTMAPVTTTATMNSDDDLTDDEEVYLKKREARRKT